MFYLKSVTITPSNKSINSCHSVFTKFPNKIRLNQNKKVVVQKVVRVGRALYFNYIHLIFIYTYKFIIFKCNTESLN